MRAVITGGAGFLGSHLCDRFLAEGWEVLALYNLVTGVDSNVGHLGKESQVRHCALRCIQVHRGSRPRGLRAAFCFACEPADYLKHADSDNESGFDGHT